MKKKMYPASFYDRFVEVVHDFEKAHQFTKDKLGEHIVYFVTKEYGGIMWKKNSYVVSRNYAIGRMKDPNCLFVQFNNEILLDKLEDQESQLKLAI